MKLMLFSSALLVAAALLVQAAHAYRPPPCGQGYVRDSNGNCRLNVLPINPSKTLKKANRRPG